MYDRRVAVTRLLQPGIFLLNEDDVHGIVLVFKFIGVFYCCG
jgi:hypothetical protein